MNLPQHPHIPMDEDNIPIIEWIISQTRETYAKQSIRQKINNRIPRLKVDDHIKYCEPCMNTWYEHKAGGSNTGKWSYNIKGSIPTIGKSRELCPNCKSEK